MAATRIVPAILFPTVSYLLPLPLAFAWVAVSAFSLVFFAGTGAEGETLYSVVILALWGIGAGGIFRRRANGRAGVPGAGAAGGNVVPGAGRRETTGSGGDDPASEDPLEALRSLSDTTAEHQRIVEGILPLTGADRVFHVSPSMAPGRPLTVRAAAPTGKTPVPGDLPPGVGLPIREMAMLRKPILVDGAEAALWMPDPKGKGPVPTGAAVVPVMVEGKAEGAIVALRYAEGPWAEPVVPALEMAAFFAGRENRRAEVIGRTWRECARQEGIHRLVRQIAGAAEEPEAQGAASSRRDVYRFTAENLRDILRAGRVALIETDEAGETGRIAWEAGEEGSFEREGSRSLAGTYAEWVLKNGTQRMFSGWREAPGKFPVLPEGWTHPEEDAWLLVPVTGASGFRGLLACSSRGDRIFRDRDAESAREFLTIMRMGLSHAQQVETLERKASTDGLTGLLNRRTFLERLDIVLARLDGRHPCAVIMLDVDHFKRINDTYGHPAGDDVLRKVSAVIAKTVRKGDFAGRYGGEEFAVYLNLVDLEQAVQAAERLRLIIRQARFEFNGREVGVTASLGVACYPVQGRTGEELLRCADGALYRSKEGGRDRVTVGESARNPISR